MQASKPKDIDEYIALFPCELQKILEQVRMTIKKVAPEAEEKISYGMPAFRLHGKDLIYFAAFAKHIGVYALPSGNEAFKKELSNYKTGKGSIQFPFDHPIPFDLLAKIVQFRAQENLAFANKKK
ncbi:MAG: DUF1801 domain-containing protein [Maribacter sp.]|nr:DUF1801 domain-containing protein [Maribacter sp.]